MKSYYDVHVLGEIGSKDVVIFRTDETMTEKDHELMIEAIHASNPNWDSALLIIRPDQSLERIPEAMAKALYEELKAVFEPRKDEVVS